MITDMSTQRTFNGALLTEEVVFTLTDVCNLCRVSGDELAAIVAEGIVEPRGRKPAEWRFTAAGVRRIRIAVRLRRDLHVNMAGAALALELLDELQALRRSHS